VPGGWLADQIGGKWLFGGGILGCAALTLLTPTAAFHGDFGGVFSVRMLEGVSEGFSLPATHALFSRWTPRWQSTRAVTLVCSGEQIGYLVGMMFGGLFSDYGFAGGWPSVFYLLGSTGCIWAFLFFCLCFSSPSTHPQISQAEREYLEVAVGPRVEKPKTPWRKILTSMPVWALCVGKVAYVWGYQTMVNGLPLFYYDVLGFDMTTNGLAASLPYLATAFTLVITGMVADWLRAQAGLSTTRVRKIFCACGMILSSMFLIVSPYLGCDRVLVVVVMILAMGCKGMAWANLSVNALDLSPVHAAVLMGISNTAATLSAIAVPQVIGVLTNYNPSRAQWRKVFYISASIEWFGCFFFVLFGSGELQNWHDDTNSE